MKGHREHITFGTFHPRLACITLKSENSCTFGNSGFEEPSSVYNLPPNPHVNQVLYPENCFASHERRRTEMLMYQNPGKPQLPALRINKPVYAGGFTHYSGSHLDQQTNNSVQNHLRVPVAHKEPLRYQAQVPSFPGAMMPNRSMCHIQQKWISGGDIPMSNFSANWDKAAPFLPSHIDHVGISWGASAHLQSDLHYPKRYTESFPVLHSMHDESHVANLQWKLRETKRQPNYQQPKSHIFKVDSMEGWSKGCWLGMRKPTRVVSALSNQNSDSMKFNAGRKNNTMKVNYVSRRNLAVDEVGGNQESNGVKSKYRHGKCFVQRLLGIRYDSQTRKIDSEKVQYQQTYWEDKYKVHSNSVRSTTIGRFNFPNCNCCRMKWRYNKARWVTVSAFCNSLEYMCQKNSLSGQPKKPLENSRFHAPNVSHIPLAGYLKRIAWFFECSKECFVIALEYIHHLVRVRPEVEVNYSTVRQLTVAALRVSNKFIDDKYISNSYYAHIVDLPANTISVFEAQLLFFLNFDLNLPPEQYYARYKTMLANNHGPGKVSIWPIGK